MSLRVRNLLDNPALGTRLLAGKTGLDRTVAWAHSCEVAKPWEWMGSDELLMSIPGGRASLLQEVAQGGGRRLAGALPCGLAE